MAVQECNMEMGACKLISCRTDGAVTEYPIKQPQFLTKKAQDTPPHTFTTIPVVEVTTDTTREPVEGLAANREGDKERHQEPHPDLHLVKEGEALVQAAGRGLSPAAVRVKGKVIAAVRVGEEVVKTKVRVIKKK